MAKDILLGVPMLRRLTDHARQHGMNPADVLGHAGLPPDALDDADNFFPVATVGKAYAYAAEHLEDPALGLTLAIDSATTDYGVIGYIVCNHPDLDEGFATICRYSTALMSPGRLDYERRGSRVLFRVEMPLRLRGIDVLVQDMIGGVLLAGRRAVGREFKALSLQLGFDTSVPERFEEFFGVAPTFDGTAAATLQLAASDVKVPVKGADPALLQHLLEAVEHQLSKRRRARGDSNRLLMLKGCIIDLEEGLVRRGPKTFSLTTKERAILEYFRSRPNQVVTHSDLERDLWGIGRSVISHAPAVAIRRLRQKIEPPSERPINLVTVFGEGWKLVVPDRETRTLGG